MKKEKMKRVASVTAFAMALMVICSGASAEDLFANVNPPPPPHCEQSSLTGDKFMEAFRAIAMHGDLRDVPFIEKTLHVKFTSKNYLEMKYPRQIDPHRKIYTATSMFNAPLRVQMEIGDDEDSHNAGEGVAAISFVGDEGENFFNKCLHITAAQFDGYFGSTFKRRMFQNSTAFGGSAEKQFDDVGKNKAKIKVDYLVPLLTGDPIVSNPVIRQLQ